MTVTHMRVVESPPPVGPRMVAKIYAFPQKSEAANEGDFTFVTEDDDVEVKVVEPRRRPGRPKATAAAETKRVRRPRPAKESG